MKTVILMMMLMLITMMILNDIAAAIASGDEYANDVENDDWISKITMMKLILKNTKAVSMMVIIVKFVSTAKLSDIL